jgi:hypothetical protein
LKNHCIVGLVNHGPAANCWYDPVKKLMRAGVPVNAVRYLGTIHDFVMLDALAETPAAMSAVALASDELREALAR